MAPARRHQQISRPRGLLLTERLVFFGGKGGVGKTTLAAAFATTSARDRRTLLVSTDPAHSTSDLLGVALTNKPTQIHEGLWAVELDPDADAAAFIERIKDQARGSVSREVLPTIDKHLDLARFAPGTYESALFDRFVDLIHECPDPHETIVFDTAPTGHTLRLLHLPALLTAWIEGIVRQREKVSGMERMLHNLAGDESATGDPILETLRTRRERFHHARHRLMDDAVFYLVLIPERLPIEETARSLEVLDGAGMNVGALIVNRVVPELEGGDFMAARLEQQAEYLEEIDRRFAGYRRIRIEQQPRDVATAAALGALADPLATALSRS
jgi:arsenite/tail-anchored protein-transporting ATPase